MRDLWDGLPVPAQESLVLVAMLLPALLLSMAILRGMSPWPLTQAILLRFRWQAVAIALLVAVSVGLGIGLVAQERALRGATAQAADKFDLVVGAPGSEMTLLLAAVFLQPSDVPLIDGAAFTRITGHEAVSLAAPLAFGDSVDGAPVVGTISAFVSHLSEDRISGRLWEEHDEAIVGALTPYGIGDELEPAHGFAGSAEHDAHGGHHLTVVGRMAATGTPWDRAVLVPVEAVWETHGLAAGHAPEHADRIGPPFDAEYFPGTPAVVVRAETFAATYVLRAALQDADGTMAFFPGTVLSQLYAIMGDVRQAMSVMSFVTQVLVVVSVLLCLFLMIRLVRRQLALLRALGAPARFVVALVWSLSASLLAVGAGFGLAFGYGAAAVLSFVVSARTDLHIQAGLGWTEFHLVAAFVTFSCLAALLPALLALREEIAEGLRS